MKIEKKIFYLVLVLLLQMTWTHLAAKNCVAQIPPHGYIELIKPYAYATVNYDDSVIFQWSPCPGATKYRLWITKDNAQWVFVDFEYETTATALQVPMSLACPTEAGNGTYIWNVSYYSPTNNNWWGTSPVRVVSLSNVPNSGKPRITSPVDARDPLNMVHYNTGEDVRFSWESVSGAAFYQYQLKHISQSDWQWANFLSPVELEVAFHLEGQWHWRVLVANSDGEVIANSRTRIVRVSNTLESSSNSTATQSLDLSDKFIFPGMENDLFPVQIPADIGRNLKMNENIINIKDIEIENVNPELSCVLQKKPINPEEKILLSSELLTKGDYKGFNLVSIKEQETINVDYINDYIDLIINATTFQWQEMFDNVLTFK